MVKIVIENLGQKELTLDNERKSVLKHLQDHFVDWMHACGAKGRCTTCKMEIIEGMENLGELTEAEIKYRNAGELIENERLSCQAKLMGNIRIKVPHSGKLPHMTYTD
jgi:2Fe-2S ferredoxin